MGRIYRQVLLVLVSIVFLNFSIAHASQEEETYFIITAYYSPLPGQSSYLNGSYEREIYVNGKGTNGASGREVFEGMLAAPRNYPFGTKIYFEGLGIGEVQDRGGAIVEAGERGYSYDRIDIWMGYGDEGLARAKTWGKRTVKGKIVVPSSQTSIQFGKSKLGDISSLKVSPESDTQSIQKLQEIFTKADLYNGEIDGQYSSIEQELIDFQIASGIITDAEDWGAGYFGNKTIAALREKYGVESPLVEEPAENFSAFNHRIQSQKYKIILEYGELEISPESSEENIREFQQLMTKLGEYNGVVDGKYLSIEPALIELQKKIGVITNPDDWGAGYFGSKTKTALWEFYGNEDNTISEKITTPEDSQIDLSSKQKQELDTTIEKLRIALEKLAMKRGKTTENLTQELKTDIEEILPKLQKEVLKNKLLYIAENL